MSEKTYSMKPMKPRRFYHNFRVTMLIMLLPVGIGLFAVYYILSGSLSAQLGDFGNRRLETDNWQTAVAYLANSQPDYGINKAYYKLGVNQDINWAAEHFSVDQAKLKELNPGTITYGTTIAVPPVENPLQPFDHTTGNLTIAIVRNEDGILRVSNEFYNPLIRTTIPELTQFLARYNAITKIADKHYRINLPISIEKNIRVDITDTTVSQLELSSSQNFAISCLCLEDAELLIKDTKITSIDPATNQPDTFQEDGRSFIRARKSSRMDILNSDISYLGNDLLNGRLHNPLLRSGGTYGISWRITDKGLGQDIATGWVEGNNFHHNRFGGYTFGASGMMWRNNVFSENEVYGLDPHDDSNNATIEGNRFANNGKHGFIVSKRCNNNVIRNNVSVNNKLHGYMLHQDSNYNLIENNVAIGNTDNFVIYGSNNNTIRKNKSYNPISSHVRINAKANHNYIENNLFYGGERGLFFYDITDGVLAQGNVFHKLKENILVTKQASRIVFTNNLIDGLKYDIVGGDRVVFGPNEIQTKPKVDISPLYRAY